MNPVNNNDALSQELKSLTDEELAIIYGILLGDGHIQKRGGSYRLKIEHSIDQLDYVLWKHNKLNRLCSTTQPPKIINRTVEGKPHQSVEFYTSSGKWLKRFHDLFYKKDSTDKYKKVVTEELINKLPINAILLAVFFMDDGSVRNDCYSGKLATQGFSKEGNNLLKEYFQKYNIGCEVVLHNKIKQQYYLSIPVGSFGKLMSLIESTVRQVKGMEYKLNEDQKNKKLDMLKQ